MLFAKHIKAKHKLEFANKHYSFIKNYFIKYIKDFSKL
jgi:hypothetical protein